MEVLYVNIHKLTRYQLCGQVDRDLIIMYFYLNSYITLHETLNSLQSRVLSRHDQFSAKINSSDNIFCDNETIPGQVNNWLKKIFPG